MQWRQANLVICWGFINLSATDRSIAQKILTSMHTFIFFQSPNIKIMILWTNYVMLHYKPPHVATLKLYFRCTNRLLRSTPGLRPSIKTKAKNSDKHMFTQWMSQYHKSEYGSTVTINVLIAKLKICSQEYCSKFCYEQGIKQSWECFGLW